MLQSTFIHLPGIAGKSEKFFWDQGIYTWDLLRKELHRNSRRLGVSDRRKAIILKALNASASALEFSDVEYFSARLPRKEWFRIALSFPEKTAFLDIETTGLSNVYHRVTIIGLDKNGIYQSAFAEKEDSISIQNTLSQCACVVTFNGTRFDLPFLETKCSWLKTPVVHIDLMYVARRVGLHGGQKKIEKKLGFQRSKELQSNDGANAPALWYAYMYGDIDSGRKLIEYNQFDIRGMQYIFAESLRRLLRDAPLRIRSEVKQSCRLFEKSAKKNTSLSFIPPYKGDIGPAITYRELKQEFDGPMKVIGIDLSGSERRSTGWCILEEDCAKTRLIRTDAEILEATVSSKPDLVSIDSPLSLPVGRNIVEDSDPTRYTAGITRQCERILKQRGVNVYPSLIESMQKLTARGIGLATQLRQLGIPVIESYPGGAQDIIGLPRKQNSLALLKRGLSEFGINGKYEAEKVSHDEIDAITSAIVGLFFWSGRFEAIGNADEDYLIVPELRQKDITSSDQRAVVGISGPIGAGKTTLAKYLKDKYGFSYRRYSQVLHELLTEQGIKPTRESLQEYGQYVHEHLGQRWLNKQLCKRMPEKGDIVIDGLRFPEDRSSLIEHFGSSFMHLHVDASKPVRRARYAKDRGTVIEFDRAIEHSVESSISTMKSLPNCVVVRNDNRSHIFDDVVSAIELNYRRRLLANDLKSKN